MLTERQQVTYQFIRGYHLQHGRAPKLTEIAEGIGISSKGVVHRYLKAIAEDGLIDLLPGRHRGIRLTSDTYLESQSTTLTLPLLGKIAAGCPIEAIPNHDSFNFAAFFLGPDRFVLKVQGDSMIDAGILDGDMVIIKQQNHANDGDIIVALIDQYEATLKYLQQNRDGTVTLLPANETMQPITYLADRVQIQGVAVGQMRTYEAGKHQ